MVGIWGGGFQQSSTKVLANLKPSSRLEFEEASSIENGAIRRQPPKFSPEVIERAVRAAFDAKDQ